MPEVEVIRHLDEVNERLKKHALRVEEPKRSGVISTGIPRRPDYPYGVAFHLAPCSEEPGNWEIANGLVLAEKNRSFGLWMG